MKTKETATPAVDPDTLKGNEIARSIQRTGINPVGFRVEYRAGVVQIGGTVRSEDERQRVLQAARGNTGVREVQDQLKVEGGTTPGFGGIGSGATPGSVATRAYMVKKGDTLSAIAKQFYGNAAEYQRIFDANKDQLSDPDEIKPGQVLKIP